MSGQEKNTYFFWFFLVLCVIPIAYFGLHAFVGLFNLGWVFLFSFLYLGIEGFIAEPMILVRYVPLALYPYVSILALYVGYRFLKMLYIATYNKKSLAMISIVWPISFFILNNFFIQPPNSDTTNPISPSLYGVNTQAFIELVLILIVSFIFFYVADFFLKKNDAY